MKQKLLKKTIALFCAILVSVTCINWPIKAEAAGTPEWREVPGAARTIDEVGYAFERLTFSDFAFYQGNSANVEYTAGEVVEEAVLSGNSSGTVQRIAATNATRDTWDKTLFRGKVKFTQNPNNYLLFTRTTENQKGFKIGGYRQAGKMQIHLYAHTAFTEFTIDTVKFIKIYYD